MRLLIISHTEHYLRDGKVVGWGATVREIDHLATLFDEVVHVAPLHEGPAPPSALPYTAPAVTLRSVPPAGGTTLSDKLDILRTYPAYARVINKERKRADVVHVRCPANISLLALFVMTLLRSPQTRWYKYAGNWQAYPGEPWSYRVQRWWLRTRLAGGRVTVNGRWPGQRSHVQTFYNPCLTEAELMAARRNTAGKRLMGTVNLLFVGALTPEKGIMQAVAACIWLRRQGVDTGLEVVGGGPLRAETQALVRALGMGTNVTFHGWIPRTELGTYYQRAHILVLPSKTEGWPKVISEAMAYGVVPVAGAVGSISQYLEAFGVGEALNTTDGSTLGEAVLRYVRYPNQWLAESQRATEAAKWFTYTYYLGAVKQLLGFSKDAAGQASRSASSIRAASEMIG